MNSSFCILGPFSWSVAQAQWRHKGGTRAAAEAAHVAVTCCDVLWHETTRSFQVEIKSSDSKLKYHSDPYGQPLGSHCHMLMVTLWSHFSSHSSHFSNTQDVTRCHKCNVLQCPQRNRTILDSFNTDLFAFKESRWNLIAWQWDLPCLDQTELQTANSAIHSAIHSSRHWRHWRHGTNRIRRDCTLCLDCFGKGFGKPGRTCRTCRTCRTSQFEWFKERFKIHRPGTCTPALLFPFSIQACFHWNFSLK